MKILYPAFVLCLVICLSLACGEEPKKKPAKAPAKKEAKQAKVNQAATEVEEEPMEQVAPIPAEQLAKAKEIIAGVSEDAIAAVDAKKKFKLFCATCHGFKGDLNVNGAKDLTKSKIDLEGAVAQVYHGRGLMTPFKGIMEDVDIVAIAKYIETLRK